jgi:hypothetical protein
MTEPRDDEAGREALLRAMGRVLVELSYKPNDLTHEVLREAAEELRATLAPPAATAPSEPPRDEAVTAHSSTSDACGQIALATFMARTEAQGREARTRFFADLRAPNAPRDEAAALLREAREVLERYAVGWTDDGRSFDNVAVIAMRARIDAYLRRAGPEGGGDGAVALTKEQVDRVGRKIDTPEARRDRAEFDASHGAPREGDAERGRAGK